MPPNTSVTSKAWHAADDAGRVHWQEQAKGILYERGGEALLTHLQALALPPGTPAEAA